MPITYIDKELDNTDRHPGLRKDPSFRMVRYGTDGKSVFNWTRDKALAVYKWYVVMYKPCDIEDEFGEHLNRYGWSDLLERAHYNCNTTGSPTILCSEHTIKEAFDFRKAEAIAQEAKESPIMADYDAQVRPGPTLTMYGDVINDVETEPTHINPDLNEVFDLNDDEDSEASGMLGGRL